MIYFLLSLSLSALYWHPTLFPPQFARAFDLPTSQPTDQTIFFAKPDYDWGVEASLSACRGSLRYRYIDNNRHISISRGAFNQLHLNPGFGANDSVDLIDADLRMNHQNIDLRYAAPFGLITSLQWTRTVLDFTATGLGPNPQRYDFSTSFHGAGPALGFSGCYWHFEGEFLFGGLIASRKRGRGINTNSTAVTTTTTVTRPNGQTVLIYFLQGDFRFALDWRFVRLAAGYHFDHYFDGLIYAASDNLRVNQSLDQVVYTCADVTYSGPYLSLAVCF